LTIQQAHAAKTYASKKVKPITVPIEVIRRSVIAAEVSA